MFEQTQHCGFVWKPAVILIVVITNLVIGFPFGYCGYYKAAP